MEQTKYFCDICSNEVNDKRDFYLVKMAIHHGNDLLKTDSREVCELCIKEIGYNPNKGKPLYLPLDINMFRKWIRWFFKKKSVRKNDL